MLRQRLEERGQILRQGQGTQVIIDLDGRELSAAEREDLLSLFRGYSGVGSIRLGLPGGLVFDVPNSAPDGDGAGLAPTPGLSPSGSGVMFVRRTLRSGQIVRSAGHLVILGDVNAGAEVYAAGNIVVLGSLRGLAHAGVAGARDALVAATDFKPLQLGIAGAVARSPEGAQRGENELPTPEVAYLDNNMITVVPYRLQNYMEEEGEESWVR
jgi:septum site-determining protein MinC